VNKRGPQYSTQAERGVVGCLLVRSDLLDEVLDTGISPENFYSPKWGAAFGAIVSLATHGNAIDVLTVGEVLEAGDYSVPRDELLSLFIDGPVPSHAATYAARIVELARLRGILAAAFEITELAYEPASRSDVDTFCDWAEQTLLAATGRTATRAGPTPLAEVLDSTLSELRSRAAGEKRGALTGFVDLDRKLGGLRSGQLIVLGARPSVGKSALALDIALAVASTGAPVLFCSAEMGALELGQRVLAGGGVPSDRLLAGQLDGIDFDRLERKRAALVDVPVLIDDSPAMTLLAIRTRARRQLASGGLGLVIVDYLQLIGGERRERREVEVAETSRGLKALARELGVPVLAVAQLNRAVELRSDKRPLLADLRDSGQVEQDGDVVLLLHRPAVYDLDVDPGAAELIVAKHRNGPTGSIPLVWLSHRMSFANAVNSGADF
jgi:replicative DNA helicase